MPYHRVAIGMARPSTARRIALCEQRAVGIAAGENVVPGRSNRRACLGERRVSREIDAVGVQLLDTPRDLDALRIDPRPLTDPIARVNCRRVA